MNLIFEINYIVFSIFASLLITEIMASVALLLFWEKTKTVVLGYVKPIWEITGTFGAFWVVTDYFAYPSLLLPVASLFAPLLTVFLFLFVARNASIVFAEFIVKKGWLDEVKLFKLYALSTIILGITVLILISTLVSGAGINLNAGNFSPWRWISSPGSIPFIVGTLFIVVGATPVFFALNSFKNYVAPLTVTGIIISIIAYYLYSPEFISVTMLFPVALTLLIGALFLVSCKTAQLVSNKAIFVSLLSIIIFSLQSLVYPSAIGRAIDVDSVTVSGPTVSAYLTITIIGGTILTFMLILYLYVANRMKGSINM